MIVKNPFLLKMIYYISFNMAIIFLLLILIFLLREWFYMKSPDYRYRIKYFYLNWLLIIIYVLGYLGIIFCLRIYTINTETDLKPYIEYIKHVYNCTNIFIFILNSLMIIFCLLAIFYLMACIHKFFVIQLTKRYLIISIKFILEYHFDPQKYLFLYKANTFLKILVFDIIILILQKIHIGYSIETKNRLWHLCRYTINFSVMTLPTVALYLWILHNLFYNNLVLSADFYKYILFYFIYFTCKRIHFFIDESDYALNLILYRMYYLERSYWYVNIPQEYQDVISRYLNLGLSRSMSKYPEPLLDEVLGHYSWFMATECCFRSDDGYYYTNGRHQFGEESNERKDIIIDYKAAKNLVDKIMNNYTALIYYLISVFLMIELFVLCLLRYTMDTIFFLFLLAISNVLIIIIIIMVLFYSLNIIFNHKKNDSRRIL